MASLFPCPTDGTCFDPANPLRNLSAEDVDGPRVIPGFAAFIPPPPLGSPSDAPIQVSGFSGGSVCRDGTFETSFVVIGGVPPFLFNVVTPIPGATVSHDGERAGTVSAIPNATGHHSMTLQITDSLGEVSFETVILNTQGITTTVIPGGTVGDPYSLQLTANMQTTPVYSITGGSLPSGLALSPSGLISGTPTGAGNFNFALTVSDDFGTACSTPFSMEVETASDCPNWDNAIWSVDGGNTFAINSASFATSAPSVGNTFSVQADASGPDGNGQVTIFTNDLPVSAACNFNLELNVISYTAIGAGFGNGSVMITYDNGGGPVIIFFTVFAGWDPTTVGVTNWPVAVPGAGTVRIAQVLAVAQGPFALDQGGIIYTGTLTNLP